MIGFAAQRLMDLEAEAMCDAGHGERSPDRVNATATATGSGRRAPAPSSCAFRRCAKGSYFPGFLEPRRMAEEGADGCDRGAYVDGDSTRSVDELVKAIGMTGISKSQVSRLCGEIDDTIAAFLDRSLEGDWPYLWLDATYLKVRQSGRIVSITLIISVAVNGDRRREVLGRTTGASEAETFWTDFLRSLARRGLRGVKLVVSDAHVGLKKAVAKVLYASWQRRRGGEDLPRESSRVGTLSAAGAAGGDSRTGCRLSL